MAGEASRKRPSELDELRAEGVTDYFALPLSFRNGEVHVVTWEAQRRRWIQRFRAEDNRSD